MVAILVIAGWRRWKSAKGSKGRRARTRRPWRASWGTMGGCPGGEGGEIALVGPHTCCWVGTTVEMPEQTSEMPKQTAKMPKQTAEMPKQTVEMPDAGAARDERTPRKRTTTRFEGCRSRVATLTYLLTSRGTPARVGLCFVTSMHSPPGAVCLG